jgi:hypothetical protein
MGEASAAGSVANIPISAARDVTFAAFSRDTEERLNAAQCHALTYHIISWLARQKLAADAGDLI